MIAGCDQICRGLAPIAHTIEQVTQRDIPTLAHGDNETMILDVKKGFSRKMSYLAKYQKVSLGMMHDYYAHPHNLLAKVDSGANRADLLTKPLDHTKHWLHCTQMGLGAE